MKFTKHLPFILKTVAVATFFLAAFVFYDSFKVAKNFKNYVVLEKTSINEAEFLELVHQFEGELVREEITFFKEYRNGEKVLQTENDSVAHYFLSLPMKGKKEATTIKRIRESVKGLYVNPFELKKGYSYYFLYDEGKDTSDKIIFAHDGEVNNKDGYFGFSSSFIKIYSEHKLILYLDLDNQRDFMVTTYDKPNRLSLKLSIPQPGIIISNQSNVSTPDFSRDTSDKTTIHVLKPTKKILDTTE